MTKSLLSGYRAHLQQGVTERATCWKIKSADGSIILGFTDHDQDLTINIGDGDIVTYKAATGYTRTAIASDADLSVDNLDLEIVLDDLGIKKADIRAGRYDDAEVKIFEVVHSNLALGFARLKRGRIGEVKIAEPSGGEAEFRDMHQALSQNLVELVTPDCAFVDLGDGRCKARLDPSVWLATTTYTVRPAQDAAKGSVVKPSVFNDRHFKCVTKGTSGGSEPAWNLSLGGQTNDGSVVWEAIRALTIEATVASLDDLRRVFRLSYSGDAPDDFLRDGLAAFTSGANAGLKKEVKKFEAAASDKVTLFEELPFDLAIGDSLTITAGCDKTVAECTATFDNIDNMRAMPYVPGQDLLLNFPDAR